MANPGLAAKKPGVEHPCSHAAGTAFWLEHSGGLCASGHTPAHLPHGLPHDGDHPCGRHAETRRPALAWHCVGYQFPAGARIGFWPGSAVFPRAAHGANRLAARVAAAHIGHDDFMDWLCQGQRTCSSEDDRGGPAGWLSAGPALSEGTDGCGGTHPRAAGLPANFTHCLFAIAVGRTHAVPAG